MDRLSKAIKLAGKKRDRVESSGLFDRGFDSVLSNRIDVHESVLEENKVVAGVLTNPVSESYRLLRTKVLRVMAQNNWRVLGITSPTAAAGKTLTAVNLSVAIAMKPNYSALLIDSDMRKVGMYDLFGIDPEFGLEEFLSGRVPLEDVVICPGIDDLGVIFNTRRLHGSSDLLMGNKLMSMIDQVTSNQDDMVAIFDMPPVFVGDDAVALSAHMDAVLVVVNSGQTTHDELQDCLKLLKGVNIIGCVLNNAPEMERHVHKYASGY